MATLILAITLGILDGACSLFTGKNHALISKCTGDSDGITFSCPHNHYMYDIYIVASVAKVGENECKYIESDCHGTFYSLEQQRKKCRWKHSCHVVLENSSREPITKAIGRKRDCIGKTADYVSFGIPKCIHKDLIFDFCARRSDIIRSMKGIIRIRNDRSNRGELRRCRRHFMFPENSTLTVKVTNLRADDRIRMEMTSGKQNLKSRIREGTARTFRSSDGTYRVRLKRNRRILSESDLALFFAVNASSYRRSSYKLYMPAGLNDVINPLGAIGNVSATVQDCISYSSKSLSFICPYGSVIYAPDVNSLVLDTCQSSNIRCKGLSPQLLVQRNKCYFKRSCSIRWTMPEPIAVASDLRCLGMMGTAITTKGYQCIKSDRVFDVCEHGDTIRRSWGLIRSHENYPWNYKERDSFCKKNIVIGSKRTLHLILDDIDLDKERDQFKIWHVHNRSCKHTVMDVMSTFKSKIELSGGQVHIRFATKRRSKAGRGFTILFKIKKTTNVETDYDKIYCSSNVDTNLKARTIRTFKNKKGLKRKRRRKKWRKKNSRNRRRYKVTM